MRALIIGADGQDGYYLREYLLSLGYEVVGVTRKKSGAGDLYSGDKDRAGYSNIYADLTDMPSLINAIADSGPDELYNLAGQSEIPLSWRQPLLTAEVNALGVMRLLETIRIVDPKIKLFQASSSELFGNDFGTICSEDTAFNPKNPYGVSKLFAHKCVTNYRDKYGLYACCGILFNHESPKRGAEYVTRKISRAAAEWAVKGKTPLLLGNLDAVRDWGSADDYVRAMWMLMQQDEPEDFVIATGVPHTVRDFVSAAFQVLGTNIVWDGKEFDEVGIDADSGQILVRVDPALFRFPRRDCILGDPRKAREKLGFTPGRSFSQLVEWMVKSDFEQLTGGANEGSDYSRCRGTL